MPDSPPPATGRQLLVASGLATGIAALVLVLLVLPAEHGIDLLGTGRLLGIDALADPRAAAVTPEPAGFRKDTTEIVLGPYQSIEYKYRMASGATLLYAWGATGELRYDLHGEPEVGPEGFAESFDAQESATAGNGTFTAPFSGIHGWYWENYGRADVTIKLRTAGFYTEAIEFFDGDQRSRSMEPVAAGFESPPR
jgi:hypothetical protein